MKRKTEPPRGFNTAEFEERLNRAQHLMHEQSLAALWLTTEAEFRYFSGFLTQFWQSPTRPWFMVVPAGGKPIAVIPEIGASYLASTWLDDIRTWPAPTPEDDGVSLLLATLREVAGQSGRVGMLMGSETYLRMPLGDFDTIRTALKQAGHEFVDATPLIRELRLIKSAAEIEKIAYICGLVSDSFVALPNLVATGMTEREIFRLFKMDVLSRGADDVPYLVGGAGAGGYEDIISPPSGRVTQTGDVLMLDTGTVFDGYFCDFDRNFAFGSPSAEVQQAHEILYQATEAGLKVARAGITAADLFHSMWRVLEKAGASASTTGRMGHGFGSQLTEWPSLVPTDQTILRPGMVITLEPALEVGRGRFMVHEEDIVIRGFGAELLTRRTPQNLPIID